MPDVALTTAYDSLYRKYAGRVPVAFLRSLAERESGTNPNAIVSGGGNAAARGLLQVVGVVRDDYNQRYGTAYTSNDLLNPEINVKLAASTLNRIMDAYEKHPSANLKPDWTNPEYVKLVTAGWNAGYSEGGGLGKVATYLESRGIPVTHDNVVKNAAAAGAVSYLSLPARAAWHRSVADLYFAQPDRATNLWMMILVFAGAAFGAYHLLR